MRIQLFKNIFIMCFVQECGVNYILDKADFTAKISISPDAAGNLIIPQEINYQSQNYILTKIEDKSFKGNKQIKSISFAKNTKNTDDQSNNNTFNWIGRYSFDYTSIEKVYIPKDVETIDVGAFCLCEKLKTVEFEENSKLNVVFEKTFMGSSIEYIIFPRKTKFIGYQCFSGCENIKNIEFLGDELRIGVCCFEYDCNLILLSFPNAHKIKMDHPTIPKGCSIFTMKMYFYRTITGNYYWDINKGLPDLF